MMQGLGDAFRDLCVQCHSSVGHLAEGAGAALPGLFGKDFIRLILSAALGAAISYVVLVARIDERQALFKETLTQQHTEIERLKAKVDANGTANTRQDATIDLRLQQCTENYVTLRGMFERIEQRLRRHEDEDREQFRHGSRK